MNNVTNSVGGASPSPPSMQSHQLPSLPLQQMGAVRHPLMQPHQTSHPIHSLPLASSSTLMQHQHLLHPPHSAAAKPMPAMPQGISYLPPAFLSQQMVNSATHMLPQQLKEMPVAYLQNTLNRAAPVPSNARTAIVAQAPPQQLATVPPSALQMQMQAMSPVPAPTALPIQPPANQGTPSRKRKINRLACVYCSKLHKKCDGDNPASCTRCTQKGIKCEYVQRMKRGPKAKRQKQLGMFEGSPAEKDFTSLFSSMSQQGMPVTPQPQSQGTQVSTPQQSGTASPVLVPPQHHAMHLPGAPSNADARYQPPSMLSQSMEDPSARAAMQMKPHMQMQDSGLMALFSQYQSQPFNPSSQSSTVPSTPSLYPPPPNQSWNFLSGYSIQKLQPATIDNSDDQPEENYANQDGEPESSSADHNTSSAPVNESGSNGEEVNNGILENQSNEEVPSDLQTGNDGSLTTTTISSTNLSLQNVRNINVLYCVTGSVAAIKAPDVIKAFLASKRYNFEVRVALSDHARGFVSAHSLESIHPSVKVFTDADEWSTWSKVGDPVMHIELRRWADVLLIAPLSANTLAKISNGLCDNLVTCVCRAWDITKPFIVAPAMNTLMWEHPFTNKQLHILQTDLRVKVIDPVVKTLACGDTGKGAMASPQTIVEEVENVVATTEQML